MSASQTAKTNAAQTNEDIGEQLLALRADLTKLAGTVTHDVSDGFEEAGRQIGQTGRDAHKMATKTVRDNPLMAVGIAAAVGVLLGFLAHKA
ncbi:MAG: DUF883 family protein [Oceanicaulis sp.]|nr:DUF883 family protein [Oceanicaulis sp.]